MTKKIVVEYEFADGFEDTDNTNVLPGIVYNEDVVGSEAPGVMMTRKRYEIMRGLVNAALLYVKVAEATRDEWITQSLPDEGSAYNALSDAAASYRVMGEYD